MNSIELVQGTDEWRRARAGSLGASQIGDMMAKTRTGWGASRANLEAQLLVERLTSEPTNGFVSAAMQWGTDTEPQARIAYEFHANAEVVEVGLIRHPTISNSHASPDGLVGEHGMIEIKCPQSAQHIATLLGEPIAAKYIAQAQWQMACSGRQWVDWISFDPRFPPIMQLHVRRITRDNAMIAELEKEARTFLAELDAKVAQLTSLYEKAA